MESYEDYCLFFGILYVYFLVVRKAAVLVEGKNPTYPFDLGNIPRI